MSHSLGMFLLFSVRRALASIKSLLHSMPVGIFISIVYGIGPKCSDFSCRRLLDLLPAASDSSRDDEPCAHGLPARPPAKSSSIYEDKTTITVVISAERKSFSCHRGGIHTHTHSSATAYCHSLRLEIVSIMSRREEIFCLHTQI